MECQNKRYSGAWWIQQYKCQVNTYVWLINQLNKERSEFVVTGGAKDLAYLDKCRVDLQKGLDHAHGRLQAFSISSGLTPTSICVTEVQQ